MVSKEQFVKDALMRQEMRRCREKEEYALAIINLENAYESYMHNKSYSRGRKCTKPQYQCQKGKHMRIKPIFDGNVSIDDVMICPKCGESAYSHSTDEIDFEQDGTGHYYVDCSCKNCGHDFRLYTKFNYTITESLTRG